MQDLLEKEENSIGGGVESYLPAGWPWRDPETVSRYVKKEKHNFAVYCFHRPPKPRAAGRVSFRATCRRRSSATASTKYPTATNLSYVPVETVNTFIKLLQLPVGWNSYNAKPIRGENLGAALSLLNRVMRPGTPAPIVVPTVRGGVQLEWHTRGINLEIAIDAADDINFFAEDIRTNEVPENLDEASLAPWVDRISTR